jgi:hypothetical protein
MDLPELGTLLGMLREHGVTSYRDGNLSLRLAVSLPAPQGEREPAAPESVDDDDTPAAPTTDMLFALEGIIERQRNEPKS